MLTRSRPVIAALTLSLLAAACAGGKDDVDEDFSDLADLQDTKADAFSYRLKLLGELSPGAPRTVLYKSTPRFRGFTIQAAAGDTLDLWVRGPRGDALTWLLDDKFRVVDKNDDADEDTLDSFISVRPSTSHGGLYYVVFRDYYLESRRFTIELNVTPPDTSADTPVPLANQWLGYALANGGSFGWPMGPEDLSEAARAKYTEYVNRDFPTAVISAYGFATEIGETAIAVVGCQEETGFVDLFSPDGAFVIHGATGDSCSGPTWRWLPVSSPWDPSVCDCTDGGYPACGWC